MILIAGIASEEPTAQVIESADSLGIDYLVFNQRDAGHYDLRTSITANSLRAELCIGGQWIDLTTLDGLYARLMPPDTFPDVQVKGTALRLPPALHQRRHFINTLFTQLVDLLPIRVINRHEAMESNFSKPYQLAAIRAVGLGIPATLMTNQVGAVGAFEAEREALIFKSISSTRSIVKVLTGEYRDRLANLTALPTQFQERLQGHNIRVHVVGDALFAASIDSTDVDYRYAGSGGGTTTMQPVTLPRAIEKACFDLSKRLTLPLCGIDLFKTEQGAYYCFEVNPSPGYTYFQHEAGLPISDAIARYLATGSAVLQPVH
ncbi:RimK family alpha-L-glutamate ligase [Fibrella sp. WM1]|uniref:ATP-grasp domain-containing protein n=1 Tax=Fibrella musci TaxID=3242485 RepID=UPI003520ADB3